MTEITFLENLFLLLSGIGGLLILLVLMAIIADYIESRLNGRGGS